MAVLRVTLEFSPVDTSDIPARLLAVVPTYLVTQEADEEVWVPNIPLPEPFPEGLDHQDLSSYCLKLPVERQGKAETWTEASYMKEIIYRMGAKTPVSVAVQVNPETPICFVCERPLDLFLLNLRASHAENRGWCPLHINHLTWKKEWRQQQEYKQVSVPLETFLTNCEQMLLDAWRLQDRLWWEDQRKQRTSRYLDFLSQKGLDPSKWSSSPGSSVP